MERSNKGEKVQSEQNEQNEQTEIDKEIIQRTLEVIQAGEKKSVAVEQNQRYKRSLAEQPQQPQQPKQSYLTKKEFNSLKAHKYEEAVKRFTTSYVIVNKKTGMVVELKAATACHACTMIGWKVKHCQVLEVKKEKPQETTEIAEIIEVKPTEIVNALNSPSLPETVVISEPIEIENPEANPNPNPNPN